MYTKETAPTTRRGLPPLPCPARTLDSVATGPLLLRLEAVEIVLRGRVLFFHVHGPCEGVSPFMPSIPTFYAIFKDTILPADATNKITQGLFC